jgi:hypothetical protein
MGNLILSHFGKKKSKETKILCILLSKFLELIAEKKENIVLNYKWMLKILK